MVPREKRINLIDIARVMDPIKVFEGRAKKLRVILEGWWEWWCLWWQCW